MEIGLLFAFIVLVAVAIKFYSAYAEANILKAILHAIDHGHVYNNQIHVADLCQQSDCDDFNEVNLYFNKLQSTGKISSDLVIRGVGTDVGYHEFMQEHHQ